VQHHVKPGGAPPGISQPLGGRFGRQSDYTLRSMSRGHAPQAPLGRQHPDVRFINGGGAHTEVYHFRLMFHGWNTSFQRVISSQAHNQHRIRPEGNYNVRQVRRQGGTSMDIER
jgi:hypothetical protein